MAKTKILYVITKSNWGGAQKYVYELATGLPKEKFEPAVVLGGNGMLAQKLRNSAIRVINLKNLERDVNIFKEFRALIGLIKIFIKEKPDIVHLNSSKIGGLGALAGRLAGVRKIIFTAHGFAFNEDRPRLIRLIFFLLSYATIILSHKTIVINQKELDQIKNLPFIKNKLELICIGIGEPPKIAEEKKRDSESPVVIGTISELTQNKGLRYAIDAVARLKNKNIVFSIIGEGEERKNLENLIKEKGLEDRVQLLGFKESVAGYLNLFDIFTLTSVKEGMPYAILEAGLAGLPVVASNVGGIGEIIENGESGMLVEPKNVGQIVEALTNLIDNPQKRKELGRNLRKTVLEKFSLQKMLEKTQKLYIQF